MRAPLVLLIILLTVLPLSAQQAVTDSSDTTYAPIDSLNAGLDLALDVLTMTRDDLTFRGDYLEPDYYRLPIIDHYMETPLSLIDFAEWNSKNCDFSALAEIEPDIFGSRPVRMELMDHEIDKILVSLSGRKDIDVREQSWIKFILAFIDEIDFYSISRISEYSRAEIDSLKLGFTLMLEENVDDEFLSAAELDSLEQYEEEWAGNLAKLAQKCVKRDQVLTELDIFLKRIVSSFRHDSFVRSTPKIIQTEMGQIIFGDTTGNHYSGDLFIVFDPGGDDTYDVAFEGTGHHTYIIDYDGNDVYNMPKNRISPYFLGSNVIIDYAGDDAYNAGSWTLGAGLFGLGLLWDMKGDDRYFGDTFTQGAGCFGVGILRDDEGNDTYQAALYSQGFGFTEGIGVLIDNSGNDNYFAGGKYKDFIRYNDHYLSLSQGFAYGIRPKMSGGVGMLIDKSGNDVYISDIFGQAASYWYGLGVLADGGGNDQYISFQYAQGNGTHMSLGILYDVSGNDVYSAKGVSQGCGHDRAAGLLIDLDGDDNYNAYDLCQGAGSANGLGIIADIRGKDVYIVRSEKNTQGYGNPRREYGSIGIFIDLGGKDGYSGGLGNDGRWWTYSMWGAGIDK